MIQLKKMENSIRGSRSLVNLKLIRICISNGFNQYMQYQTTGKTHYIYLYHHLIKSNQIHSVEKLTGKELYFDILSIRNSYVNLTKLF